MSEDFAAMRRLLGILSVIVVLWGVLTIAEVALKLASKKAPAAEAKR